jgi:hypothetical protein
MRWIDLNWLEDEEETQETDEDSLSYENRQREWTGFEGELWVNQWYRNQRRPIHKHFAQENKMNFTTFKGKLYKAIRREELEKYEELTEEQLTGLPADEFHDLTDAVLSDLARMENAVKKRKAMFDRMKKVRLANELENTKGSVVELTDVVMMLTEQKGRTSWAKLLTELKKLKPELKELLDELQEKFTGKPVPMVKKYPKKKEPKKWKSLEHIPLRGGSALRRVAQQADELGELRFIRKLNAFLDKWIRHLSSYLEMPSRYVARTKDAKLFKRRRKNPEDKLLNEIDKLEEDIYSLHDRRNRSTDDERFHFEKDLDKLQSQLSDRKKRFQQIRRQPRVSSYYAEDEIMDAIEDLEAEMDRLERKMEEGYASDDDHILWQEYQDELDDLREQLRQTLRFWRKY